jgi:hypothetical protein
MSNSVDGFLAICTPAVRDLAQRLRALIQHTLPGAVEQVDLPSNMISYGHNRSYDGLICGITPSRGHVSLLFAHGAALPDPDHLLEGEGKGARRLKIATPADVENPALQALLVSAGSKS